MKTSKPMDGSVNWAEVCSIVGPCIRPGGTLLTERALQICSLPPAACVADIGCGAGGTLEHLERTGAYRLFGLDYSEALRGEALTRMASGRLVQGRAETLPFKEGAFDALFCECVLSILDDRVPALHEFARVLKEQGYLVVSDVFGRGCPGSGGLIARDALISLLTELGFSLLLWEEHERVLREFAARMILAGERLPDPWGCGPGRIGKLSYFLLVARKSGGSFQQVGNR